MLFPTLHYQLIHHALGLLPLYHKHSRPNACLQLAALEASVRDGDAYSALQRYKALFSRGKSNADDAILILSSVSTTRLAYI
jgi:hypothetical protein